MLVRVDGIGDALVCTPLIAALRDAGHTLGALLSTRNSQAFAARTFATVHTIRRIPWPAHGATPESRMAALDAARAMRYDIALIASEELDAYEFACDANVARRVGFVNGWEKPFKTLALRPMLTDTLERPAAAARAREHEVETLFRLGAGLHTEAAPPRDVERLSELVLDDAPVRGESIVVQLSPKLAGFGLDATAYAALVRSLRAAFGRVVGIADDLAFANEVASQTGNGGAPLDVRFPQSVPAWKALLAASRAIVAPDSGATHVAGMTGVPAVALFGAARDAAHDVRRWRPWAAPYRTRIVDLARDSRSLTALVEGVTSDVATMLRHRRNA